VYLRFAKGSQRDDTANSHAHRVWNGKPAKISALIKRKRQESGYFTPEIAWNYLLTRQFGFSFFHGKWRLEKLLYLM
jgi:hypothetical protein